MKSGRRRELLLHDEEPLFLIYRSQGELPPEGVEEALGRVVDEWDRLQAELRSSPLNRKHRVRNCQRTLSSSLRPALDTRSPTPEAKSPQPEMTEKEIAKMHALRYAYVDGTPMS